MRVRAAGSPPARAVLEELYCMQNAKDSFYMALRGRLTTINPERTVLLRGTVRPGILVEEAETPVSPVSYTHLDVYKRQVPA